MSRKSHKAAAKYSELSKERKKKQRDRQSPQPRAAFAPRTREVAQTSIAGSHTSRTATKPKAAKPRAASAHSFPGYQHVGSDLKRIGILAGGAVIILIALTFVLG